jgi:hypothetical protein
LYEHETGFFILREEHRLKVFLKRVLRRMFGHKRGEVAGGCKNYIMESLTTALGRSI